MSKFSNIHQWTTTDSTHLLRWNFTPKRKFQKIILPSFAKFLTFRMLIPFVHGVLYLHKDCGKLANFRNKLFLSREILLRIHEWRFVIQQKIGYLKKCLKFDRHSQFRACWCAQRKFAKCRIRSKVFEHHSHFCYWNSAETRTVLESLIMLCLVLCLRDFEITIVQIQIFLGKATHDM